MVIRKEILDKFKNLYFEKYKVKLTDEETLQMAIDLVNLMRVLLKPFPNEIKNNDGKAVKKP